MRYLIGTVGLSVLLATGAGAQNTSTVIRAGTLLDGRGDRRPGVDIVVEGGRITAVRAARGGTPTYDLSHATVMPGGIDTHVHINWHFDPDGRTHHRSPDEESLSEAALYTVENAYRTVRAGITTVQSLGAPGGSRGPRRHRAGYDPRTPDPDLARRPFAADRDPGPDPGGGPHPAGPGRGCNQDLRLREHPGGGHADHVPGPTRRGVRRGGTTRAADRGTRARPRERPARGPGRVHRDRTRRAAGPGNARPDGRARHVLRSKHPPDLPQLLREP